MRAVHGLVVRMGPVRAGDLTHVPGRETLLELLALPELRRYLGWSFDEAINVTSRAVHGVHTISGSGRTITDLRRTIDLLGRQKYPPAKSFATAAHRLLPTAV